MIKKINLISFSFFFYLSLITCAQANFQEELINRYKKINTLHFNFTQKIGEKIETGNCYIKYPLLMRCEYPKKKKTIISNGKSFAIVKRRYKKIYSYPLKKTPLFYLLNKENILKVLQKYEPSINNSNIIEYILVDDKLNKLNIFFNKNSLNLSGWRTTDAYSNEVVFLIEKLEMNKFIENKIFKIPREDDL